MQGNKIHHEGTKDTEILDNSNSELRVLRVLRGAEFRVLDSGTD